MLTYIHTNITDFNFFFLHSASLESARKSAADSNYETTDDDRLGRGKRQHILHNRFSSEDEENYHLPSRPCKSKSPSNIKF